MRFWALLAAGRAPQRDTSDAGYPQFASPPKRQQRALVDSNVLLDIATNDPHWADWSGRALSEVAEHTTLIINPIIYAEVSVGYANISKICGRGASCDLVSARTASFGGGLSGGKKVSGVSPPSGGFRPSPLPDFCKPGYMPLSAP